MSEDAAGAAVVAIGVPALTGDAAKKAARPMIPSDVANVFFFIDYSSGIFFGFSLVVKEALILKRIEQKVIIDKKTDYTDKEISLLKKEIDSLRKSKNINESASTIEYDVDTELSFNKKYNDELKKLTKGESIKVTNPLRVKAANKVYGGKVFTNNGVTYTIVVNPKAKSEGDILTITAKKAEQAGFDGVEIHAAHGYLLAQFLSPLTNKRADKWGGSLENRARLLIEIVTSIKAACSKEFAVAVKLNSADFQRGGFDVDDAQQVVTMLAELQVDLVELSGGSYEAPAMQGQSGDDRTLAREAYFLEFASKIAENSSIPIMTTGGIRRFEVANQVVESGVELVGLASALALTPDLPNKWQKDPAELGHIPVVNWKDKTLSGLAVMALVKQQLRRVAAGKSAKTSASPIWAIITDQLRSAKLTKRYRKQHSGEVS